VTKIIVLYTCVRHLFIYFNCYRFVLHNIRSTVNIFCERFYNLVLELWCANRMSQLVGDGHIGIVEFAIAHNDGSASRLLSPMSSTSRTNGERDSKEAVQTGKNNRHGLCRLSAHYCRTCFFSLHSIIPNLHRPTRRDKTVLSCRVHQGTLPRQWIFVGFMYMFTNTMHFCGFVRRTNSLDAGD